jgi:hypothetical protein
MRHVVAWACILGLVPSVALAQPPVAPSDSSNPTSTNPADEPLTGPARDAYDAARSKATRGDFASALANFRDAYHLSGDPRMIYDMAVCARRLGMYARTRTLLAEYVRQEGASLMPADRDAIDAALAALSSHMAMVQIAVDVEGASVSVDGEPAGTSPLSGPIPVDAGVHAVAVNKPGFEAYETTIDAAGGSELSVSVPMVALPARGRLRITAEAAARIVVDDRGASRPPFDGVLPAGPHDVRVTEADRVPFHAIVRLGADETRTLDVALEKQHHPSLWPWVVGGAVAIAALATGGYFVFRMHDSPNSAPAAQFAVVQFR